MKQFGQPVLKSAPSTSLISVAQDRAGPRQKQNAKGTRVVQRLTNGQLVRALTNVSTSVKGFAPSPKFLLVSYAASVPRLLWRALPCPALVGVPPSLPRSGRLMLSNAQQSSSALTKTSSCPGRCAKFFWARTISPRKSGKNQLKPENIDLKLQIYYI